VIVQSSALSERRVSSILWMECRTVVWCLPPNSWPISWSDALVSCLAMCDLAGKVLGAPPLEAFAIQLHKALTDVI